MENEIKTIHGLIGGADKTHCEDEVDAIRREAEAEWSRMAAQHEQDLAAVQTWEETEWEVSDAVDRDAFQESQGFEYQEEFDAYETN